LAQRVADADRVALVGVSAARLHGALPRALATAVVAVGEQRRALETEWGDIVFVTRDVGVLDVQRADTDLTMGWVTTIEQTLLDIADRPTLGGIDPPAASDVLAALAPRAEWGVVADLARRQRRRAAYARARWVADGVIDADAPMPDVPSHHDRYADPLGLRPVAKTDPAPFGVAVEE
jgi:predicted transcriptional regulator of viral defense system